jgi:hypothetical protein
VIISLDETIDTLPDVTACIEEFKEDVQFLFGQRK